MPTLIPGNPLEQGLENVRSGLIELSDFLHTFIFADIIVPSATEPQPDGSGFTPLVYEKNGVDVIAAFTSMGRVQNVEEKIPYCLVIQGGEFLRRMAPGYGLIINPGWSLGLHLSPYGVREIVDSMAEPIFEPPPAS